MLETLQNSSDFASHSIDQTHEPVSLAVVCDEIHAALMPRAVAVLADVFGREIRLAGFTRVRAEGGVIDRIHRLQAGSMVLWNNRQHRLDRVEIRS